MPTKTGRSYSDYYKNDLSLKKSGNTGFSSSVTLIEDGAGQSSAISLSDDAIHVKPVADDSSATLKVKTFSNVDVLTVRTDTLEVLVNQGQQSANTQYAYFGIDNTSASSFTADVHYGIPFVTNQSNVNLLTLGSSTSSSFNDTDPATTLTLSDASIISAITCYWYIPDNIKVDSVQWLSAADTATGEDTAAHLMAYSVNTSNGVSGLDLSDGFIVADGATITNAGYEQGYFQTMTVRNANIDANSIGIFTFAQDTTNSDYVVSAIIKYHLK